MPHILLTNSFDDEAHLVVLPEDNIACKELSTIWKHAADTGETPYDKVYLINPDIGTDPMPCVTRASTTGFDSDDYATTTITIMLDAMDPEFVVTEFTYSVDGRS